VYHYRGGAPVKSRVRQVHKWQHYDRQHDHCHAEQDEQCWPAYPPPRHSCYFCQSFVLMSILPKGPSRGDHPS
jgi:hypothetical protein